MLDLIQASFWKNKIENINVTVEDYEEMKNHAIVALPAFILPKISLSTELRNKWDKAILQQVSCFVNYRNVQSSLPLTVPYVILKGTSAAKYYPYPELRAMGDIDIMTPREDFELACNQLVENGYSIVAKTYKETNLKRGSICVDLHQQFASLNNPSYVKLFDDIIIENINDTHVLPDLVNGLVILEHINQHLEGGLGLRQIIDWMMFVDKCLPDEKWPDFSELVKKIELEKLAIVCTRLCELYLGLSKRKWCAEADELLCEQLMNYVMACGNFGNKRTSDSSISENVFTYMSAPRVFLKLLQKQGLVNWRATKKHRLLRPFAWIYQLFRYTSKGLNRRHAVSHIMMEYHSAKRRKAMFEELGVKTVVKGIVMYKDGKYVKK